MVRVTFLSLLFASALAAQTKFDVASIKLNKAGDPPLNSNVLLGPGDAGTPTGGYFNATNYPLFTYILFAYRVPEPQFEALANQMPAWVTGERFDIQARLAGNPTKDQMRAMMRTLLAERCKLAMHEEAREVPVFALRRAGALGPLLQQHPDGGDCPLDGSPAQLTEDKRFPLRCGGKVIMPASAPGLVHIGSRNVTLTFIANLLSASSKSDRPIVDKTGLEDRFDFAIEFAPDQVDAAGPEFEQAVKAQLGLKLEAQKGSITAFRLDHIEHPSEN